MEQPPSVTKLSIVAYDRELGTLTAPTNGLFRYIGTGTLVQAGNTFPNNQFYVSTGVTDPVGSAAAHQGFSVDFNVSSAFFDIYTKGQSGAFRIWVDGVLTTKYYGTQTDNTGAVYRYRVDFGSARTRRVRLDLLLSFYWGGIITPNSSDVAAPDASWTVGDLAVVVGDSWTEPTGPQGHIGWARTMGEWLGLQIVESGAGGTGYVANDSGLRSTFGQRVSTDVCPFNANMVITAGGINDEQSTYSQVYAAALAYYQAVAACNSNANVLQLVLGPWENATSNATGAGTIMVDQAVQAAVAAAKAGGTNIYFLASPVQELWIAGEYSTATCTLTQNSCAYIIPSGPGASHPNQEGHDFLGEKVASRLAAQFPQFINTPDLSLILATITNGTWLQQWYQPQQLNGTISSTATSSAVTGSSTNFTTQLAIGDQIALAGSGDELCTIAAIASDTALTCGALLNGNRSGATYILTSSPLRFTVGANGPTAKQASFTNETVTNATVTNETVTAWQTTDGNSFAGPYANWALYSEFPSGSLGSTWTAYCNQSGTLTASTTDVTDPLGGNTALKMAAPSSTSGNTCSPTYPWGIVQSSITGVTVGNTYTVSAYARGAAGGETINVSMGANAVGSPNNSIPTNILCTLTTSWQRCSWTVNGYGAAGNAGIEIFASNSTLDPAGTVFYIWGAQLVPGITPGAPVVTTSAQISASGMIAIAPVLTNPSVQGTLTINGNAPSGTGGVVLTGGNVATATALHVTPAGATGQATCWKASGVLGYCSSVVGAGGACTCN